MKILKKIIKYFLWSVLVVFLLGVTILAYFNLPVKNENKEASLGVTFSSRYSSDIGLDWRKNYLAMLDDLKVRKIRIPVYWDLVEKQKDQYDFSDIDWQLDQAHKRGAKVILVVGQKVPRWPECFIPKWVQNDTQRKKELLQFLRVVVDRYKDDNTVKYWQVENEPFLKFGVCPPLDVNLLDSEIALVRFADPSRKIIVTDSGELSSWIPAARRADIFGTTMYRNVYKHGWGYYVYPIGPRFFLFKKWLIKEFANQTNSFVIELQGEPWVAGWTVNQPLSEQYKSMNAKKLEENVSYAEKSGFSEIYIWGVEWWYWLKESQHKPEVWNTAKLLITHHRSAD